MAVGYSKSEAKDWAHEHMRGVCNVLMPTFTSDLKGLNEAAIRHDVRRDLELGFWGALVVSECGTTKEEYKQFLSIVIDEARGRLRTVVHGSFDTLEDVLDVCRFAESAGADLLLTTYPPNFYPISLTEVRDYTARVLEGTSLAAILFSVHQWNFGRLHPSDLPVDVVADLAKFPNAVAIKAEGGPPGNGALVEILRACGDDLLVSDPREFNSPGWVRFFGMQWMGTSNFETFGDVVPKYFSLLHQGKWQEAMEEYWRIHPIRSRRLKDMQSWAGGNVIHRYSWKYQAWLNGFNGGPLRMPAMRLEEGAVAGLREAMLMAGTVSDDIPAGLADFYVGRNPA